MAPTDESRGRRAADADPVRLIARIGKPHGIRGEVTVQLHTDDPRARFTPGTRFATQASEGTGVPRELTLRSARDHNGIWLLAFDEIPDRTGAESLRGTRLVDDEFAGSAEGAEASGDDDGYYEDDLLGLQVVTLDGTPVGRITGLEVGAAQDLLLCELTSGGTAYLPFVESIVPEVDLAGGRVVIDPPEGLLELNL